MDKKCDICLEQRRTINTVIEKVSFAVCDRCLTELVTCPCDGRYIFPRTARRIADMRMACRYCLPVIARVRRLPSAEAALVQALMDAVAEMTGDGDGAAGV